MFQLVCDRLPEDDAELASQPTLSRFENPVGVKALFRIRALLVDQFIANAETGLTARIALRHGTAHAARHGVKWPCAAWEPTMIWSFSSPVFAKSGPMWTLRFAATGMAGLSWTVVTREQRSRRQPTPCRFIPPVPAMDEVCERLGVWYTFGIGMNTRLKRETDD